MEKIILQYNEYDAQLFLKRLNNYVAGLNRHIDKINSINSFRIRREHTLLLFEARGASLCSQVEQACQEELAKAKIQSSSVIDAAIKGDMEKFYGYHNALKIDHDFSPYVKIAEGSAIVTDEDRQKVKDKHTSFITTQEGKDLYDRATTTAS